MERDPVCGMLVDPEEAAGRREYAGRTYYFCTSDCLKKFDHAPERYAREDRPDPAGRSRP